MMRKARQRRGLRGINNIEDVGGWAGLCLNLLPCVSMMADAVAFAPKYKNGLALGIHCVSFERGVYFIHTVGYMATIEVRHCTGNYTTTQQS